MSSLIRISRAARFAFAFKNATKYTPKSNMFNNQKIASRNTL